MSRLLPAIGLIIGVVVLYLFNPLTAGFYPPCIFKKLTGLNCAGCGAARAMHSLLNGHLTRALDYNLLLVIALPFIVSGLYSFYTGRRTMLWDLANRPMIVLVIIIIFWTIRNIPCQPFLWLNADT